MLTFTRLLRLDAKAIWPKLRRMYFFGLLFLLFGSLAIWLGSHVPLLGGFGLITTVLGVLILGIGGPLSILQPLYQKYCGQERYLTHLLPVSAKKLYSASYLMAYAFALLSAFLTLLASVASVALSSFLQGENVLRIQEASKKILDFLRSNPGLSLSSLLFLVISLAMTISLIGLAMTMGMEESRRRGQAFLDVLRFLAQAYVVLQFLMLGGMLLIPITLNLPVDGIGPGVIRFGESMAPFLWEELVHGGSQASQVPLGLGFIPVAIGVTIFCYVRAIYALEHKRFLD